MAKNTTIEGMSELEGALKALGRVPTVDNILAALTSGGLEILNQAKENAPVITGTLRRSLHIGGETQLPSQPQFGQGENVNEYSDIGDGEQTPNRVSIKIGTNLEYAKPVEYGTSTRRPKPYLRPAFDSQLERAKDLTAISLVEIIKNELKNG